jgi:hypothetical protein
MLALNALKYGMTTRDLITLTGLSPTQATTVINRLNDDARRPPGRPPTLTHTRRVLLVLVWLRTNLTQRGLAAIFSICQPSTHRIIHTMLPRIAALHPNTIPPTKQHLLLDGTLIPVHDHTITRKSKNYRRSVNTQVVATNQRKIVYVSNTWTGNRNDIIVARAELPTNVTYKADGAYRAMSNTITPPPRNQPRQRARHIQVRARIEHVIARMKDWQVLRQCRARGNTINHALQAVAYLHNLRMGHLTPEL